MPQLEHIDAIERRLWSAADTLRANSKYASNEYFLPVMGLVFLRHAYSRYLAVKDGIVAELLTRGGRARPLPREDFSQKNNRSPSAGAATFPSIPGYDTVCGHARVGAKVQLRDDVVHWVDGRFQVASFGWVSFHERIP